MEIPNAKCHPLAGAESCARAPTHLLHTKQSQAKPGHSFPDSITSPSEIRLPLPKFDHFPSPYSISPLFWFLSSLLFSVVAHPSPEVRQESARSARRRFKLHSLRLMSISLSSLFSFFSAFSLSSLSSLLSLFFLTIEHHDLHFLGLADAWKVIHGQMNLL